MNDNGDFSQHPVSISEVRGQNDGKCASWTPRDILLKMLRELDSGERSVTHLMIVHTDTSDPEAEAFGYLQAGTAGAFEQIGMAAQLQHELCGARY